MVQAQMRERSLPHMYPRRKETFLSVFSKLKPTMTHISQTDMQARIVEAEILLSTPICRHRQGH